MLTLGIGAGVYFETWRRLSAKVPARRAASALTSFPVTAWTRSV